MAIAAIEHRNVARFIDLVVGDPTFLVMEYVPGPTLQKVLRANGKLEPARALSLGVRLCWALEAAHRTGIIHRDVKPANVILAPDLELGEEPKLIDFGLAKVPTLVGAENLTRTGQIVGTPQYMSPEQIANREVDPRSDVYALGCLLYHLLAGAPPFTGDDVQVLYKQIQEPAPPLPPSVPPEIAQVVTRAIAKRPDDRYRSARELAMALQQTQSPAMGLAAPSKPRNLAPMIAASLALVLIALPLAQQIASMRGAGGATLYLSSQPSGAALFLDGARLPESAPTAARGLSAGTHRLRAELAGRDSAEQTIDLARDERRAVELALHIATRRVRVESVPSGASVFLDGFEMSGSTPMEVSLGQDDYHQIAVEKSGFETAKRAIKPEDTAQSITLTLDPELKPNGRVVVDSADGAEVWIDGKNTGFVTPTIAMRVAAGDHRIELRDPNSHRSVATQVHVTQGDTLRLTLQLPVKP
jgi:hypothetical protein